MYFLPRLLAPVAAAVLLAAPLSARTANNERLPSSGTEHIASELSYRTGIVILKLDPSVPNHRDDALFGIPALDDVMNRLGIQDRRPLLPRASYSSGPRFAPAGSEPDKGFDRIYVVQFSAPFDAKTASELVQQSGVVEFAEPYYTFPLLYNPNDPGLLAQQWLGPIQARQAWDVTKGDSSVAIGIIDTGLDWAHEDLTDNVYINPGETGKDSQGRDRQSNGVDDDGNGYVDDWHGWDMVGSPTLGELQNGQYRPDNNPAPHKVNVSGYEGYHGTAVGGCASARADNGKGVAGTGFYTRLIGVKCTDDSLATGQVLAGYDGIRYAADMGARVINCSWGGAGDPNFVQALQAVVDYAYQRGALVVAASGNFSTNNDQTPQVPGNLRHVLSVGATTNQDSAASFSHYGVSVGVWAPGNNVYTTMPENLYQSNNVTGTSFSAPIVSGVAGLVVGQHPDWDPDQVAMQLRVTGDRVKVPTPQYGPYFFRRVNAFRAVTINSDLASGDTSNLPGVGVLSYTINGKAVDTIKRLDQKVLVQVTLKNYLAPTRNLVIEPFAGQALTTATPVSVQELGTMQTTTQTLEVGIDPAYPALYSEGNLQLVLHLVDGSYEDFAYVNVPIHIPGWHQQMNPRETAIAAFLGGSIKAVTPSTAWTVSNVQTSQTTQTAIFSRTTNAGATWLNFQTVPPGSEPLYAITARDNQRAWAGSGPSSGQAGIFRTTNGGSSWQRTGVQSITPFVNAVHFFDDNNGVLLGDPQSGKWGIGTTSDAGVTWSPLTTPVVPLSGTEAGWNNSYAAIGDTVWFGTNSARIYRSVDRGQTWTSASAPSMNCLGLAFADSKRGLATFSTTTTTGGNEMIASTTDGGLSWKTVSMPFTGTQTEGVTFVPGTTRAFLGTQNGVYETSDFGVTWKQMATPVMTFSGMILSAASDAQGNVGAYGTNVFSQLMTLREEASTSPSSVAVTTGNKEAAAAVLYPVTPNPVGATATIGFDLRGAAQVELALYNALGKRVMLLADGAMSAGQHSVKLDVATLPSGRYYYTLVVNGERLTQQMAIER